MGEKEKKKHVNLDESHDTVTLVKSGHKIHIPSSPHLAPKPSDHTVKGIHYSKSQTRKREGPVLLSEP